MGAPPPSKPRPLHRLLDQEYKEFSRKGLCFRCKLPYHPLHECAKKELRTLIKGEEDDIEMENFDALQVEEIVPANETSQEARSINMDGLINVFCWGHNITPHYETSGSNRCVTDYNIN